MRRLIFLALLIAAPLLVIDAQPASACWGYGYGYGALSTRLRISTRLCLCLSSTRVGLGWLGSAWLAAVVAAERPNVEFLIRSCCLNRSEQRPCLAHCG